MPDATATARTTRVAAADEAGPAPGSAGGAGAAVDDAPTGVAERGRPIWTIAELAAEFGVTLRTIRFYEDRGLLVPERRGTQRIFHARDRVRLALVLRGKRLGFSLAEIAKIVDMYDAAPGEAGQLRYLLDQIDARRDELEQRRRDIEASLAELAAVETRCREELERLGLT